MALKIDHSSSVSTKSVRAPLLSQQQATRVRGLQLKNQLKVDDQGRQEMLQTSVLGLVIGSIFAKYVHLFWIATGSMIVIIWIGFLHSIIGHSILHAAREAIYSAWSMEIGVLSGLLFDRLVRSRVR
jgi:hypothetical protein